jgi:hypothetical protein
MLLLFCGFSTAYLRQLERRESGKEGTPASYLSGREESHSVLFSSLSEIQWPGAT